MYAHAKEPVDFSDCVRRVDELWIGELDPSHIKLIEDDVIARQQALFERAKEIESKLQHDLEREFVKDLEQDHDEFRHCQYEYDRLEQVRKRLYNKRQRRIIWHALKDKLGPGPAWFLESLVLWLIVVVLTILMIEMIFADRLTATARWTLYSIDFAACMVFLYEFVLRLRLAEDKRWFWRHNWVDLVSSLPIPPVMPTADLTTLARFFRLFRILRILRAGRIVALLWSGIERLDRVADVRLMRRSLVSIAILMFVGAALVQFSENVAPVAFADSARHIFLQAALESDTAVEVQEFPDAVWWTFNTIATGGFADLYKPVKPFTRLITGLLILGGFVVLGVFIATLSAAYKGEDAQEIQRNQRSIQESIARIQIHQSEIDKRLGLTE
jgi:voltage-gated potassium channel